MIFGFGENRGIPAAVVLFEETFRTMAGLRGIRCEGDGFRRVIAGEMGAEIVSDLPQAADVVLMKEAAAVRRDVPQR